MAPAEEKVPALHHIYFYLTGACNLRCRHCWIDPVYESETTRYLPWSTWKPIFEEAQAMGLSQVKITGGEPFLHPELLTLLHDLRQKGIGLYIETNGTLITPEAARVMKEERVRCSVSLDGPRAGVHDALRGKKGSFDEALRGLENLRREDVPFQLISCLYRKNRDLLPQMIAFARDEGAVSLKFNPITGVARSEKMKEQGELLTVAETLEAYEQAYQIQQESGFPVHFDVPPAFRTLKDISQHGLNTCGILHILGVLHNGHAGLCGIGEHHKELDFGNLLELGVRRIWEENEFLRQLRQTLPHNLQGICGACLFKHYCLGKCVAQTYAEGRDPAEGFSFCQQARDEGLFPSLRRLPSQVVESAPPRQEKEGTSLSSGEEESFSSSEKEGASLSSRHLPPQTTPGRES